MNREFKFRGKRLDNSEWMYGDLLHFVDGVYISNDHGSNMAQVDPDTVGQYTGLKDKNGIVILLNTALGVILALSELIAFGLLYKTDTTMKQADYIRLTAQIAVLKEIAVDYSGKTIDNIIQQLEAIKKEVEND